MIFPRSPRIPPFVCALLLIFACNPASAQQLPGDSIYQLEPVLTDQSGQAVKLDVYRGRPVLVSMFYASCPHVCPMIVSTIQRMEGELPAAHRRQLRVLMISLDPERDTPERLADLAKRHGVDPERWTFARATAAEVRKIAAVLGVQYRQLPDGEFNHSTVITLLDHDGRIVAQTSKLGVPDPGFMEPLRGSATITR